MEGRTADKRILNLDASHPQLLKMSLLLALGRSEPGGGTDGGQKDPYFGRFRPPAAQNEAPFGVGAVRAGWRDGRLTKGPSFWTLQAPSCSKAVYRFMWNLMVGLGTVCRRLLTRWAVFDRRARRGSFGSRPKGSCGVPCYRPSMGLGAALSSTCPHKRLLLRHDVAIVRFVSVSHTFY